jgi:alpha-amylase
VGANAQSKHRMINQTIVQYFHWYYNEEEKLWKKAQKEAEFLEEIGVTMVWFPPAYKSTEGANSVGYDCYDLYDLGEFDQKGSIETKYGSKDEYVDAIKTLQDKHITVMADVVINHKAGADELEHIPVRKVNPNNREEFVSEEFMIDAWTKFTFPGRAGKYSEFIWDQHSFSGIDWAEDLKEDGVFSIQNQYGEAWEQVPSGEFGNYDYLMFNDVDFRNPAVREELKRWGEWYYNTCGMKGFRMDAVKHISPEYLNEWIDHMNATFDQKFFIVAENWETAKVEELQTYIGQTGGRMQLFDSILHTNFFIASQAYEAYDLSKIFEGTLTQSHPFLSITFVDNHDSQPLQALQSYVEYWFRPLAYALILLREHGIPCLFYPDLYGSKYTDKNEAGEMVQVELIGVPDLHTISRIRKFLAYGVQRDYFDFPNCIGWTREGDDENLHSGLAVVMSNGAEGYKTMEMGQRHAGRTFKDALGHRVEEVVIDKNGWGDFPCNEYSVSIWTSGYSQ